MNDLLVAVVLALSDDDDRIGSCLCYEERRVVTLSQLGKDLQGLDDSRQQAISEEHSEDLTRVAEHPLRGWGMDKDGNERGIRCARRRHDFEDLGGPDLGIRLVQRRAYLVEQLPRDRRCVSQNRSAGWHSRPLLHGSSRVRLDHGPLMAYWPEGHGPSTIPQDDCVPNSCHLDPRPRGEDAGQRQADRIGRRLFTGWSVCPPASLEVPESQGLTWEHTLVLGMKPKDQVSPCAPQSFDVPVEQGHQRFPVMSPGR